MLKEHPFSSERQHEQEVRGLQILLQEKEQLLDAREARIAELEELLSTAPPSPTSLSPASPVEEEVQCCLETDQLSEQSQTLQRLASILREREEEGVGLHLASRDRDSEIMALRVEAQQREGQVLQLTSQLLLAQSEAVLREKKMEKLEREMGMLRNENRTREREAGELREEVRERGREAAEGRGRESALQQQLNAAQQSLQLFMKEQERSRAELSLASAAEAELEGRQEELLRQVEKYQGEVEQLRNVLNNYEWKQFCLETELDLAAKEKKQHKYLADKAEQRLAELEAINREQRVSIYTLEEEHKILFDENRQLSREMAKKEAYIHLLSQEQEQDAQANLEELEYRINEKDEQLSALSNYLKEKIREADNFKLKSSHLQKQLEELKAAHEKQQLENYELEQSLIEHEEIMEKQSQTIDNYSKDIEFLNSKIHQEALHSILREGEEQARQQQWRQREAEWRKKEEEWRQREEQWGEEKAAIMREKQQKEHEDKARGEEQKLWEKIFRESEKQYEREIMNLLKEFEEAQRQHLEAEEGKAKLQNQLSNTEQLNDQLKCENSYLSSFLVQVENDLVAQTRRCNELSVEIIEREISNSKVAAKLESQLQEAQQLRESLKQSTSMRLQLETHLKEVEQALSAVEEADQKHRMRIVSLEQSAQEKNKVMNSMKTQINELKDEIMRLNNYNDELQREVDEAVEFMGERDQQIQALSSKVGQLKESEAKYQSEVEELKKRIAGLEEEREQMLNNQKNQQAKLETITAELKKLHQVTNERTKDLIEVLQRPVCEETVKFEVLQEEHDFEIIEGEESQNHELLRKIEEYQAQLRKIREEYEI